MLENLVSIFNKVMEQMVQPALAWVGGLLADFDLVEFVKSAFYFVFHLSLTHYLLLAAVLFTIGLLGVFTRRNLISIIISIELMLNAANINFLAFSQYLGERSGSVLVVLVLALAAAEVAVGLAIGLHVYHKSGSIDVEQFHMLQG